MSAQFFLNRLGSFLSLSLTHPFSDTKALPLPALYPCLRIPKRAKQHAICALEETWIESSPVKGRETATLAARE